MKHLFNVHLEDDSTLVIGVEGDQLVSQHDGRDPEPLGEGPPPEAKEAMRSAPDLWNHEGSYPTAAG